MIKKVMILWIPFLLASCASLGNFAEIRPPTDQEFLRIFLENGNYPLREEPGCISSGTGKPYAATVGEYFSDFGDAVVRAANDSIKDSDRETVSLVGGCGTGGFDHIEREDGTIVSGWHCYVSFYTHTRENSFIGNLKLDFLIRPDLSGIVEGSVTCLD